jgi:biotin carboxyl carrier protein
MIRSWTAPLPYEIRDDQGIGTRNPDTGAFVYYKLAGAYDSNIALILASGESRRHNLERMSEIMRQMELRGKDLETNSPVQYGLINWIFGVEPMLKPSTRFLTHYLAAVGSLQTLVIDVDLTVAAREIQNQMRDAEARRIFASKETLLLRPLVRLFADPHALAGFLGLHAGRLWTVENGAARFAANPIDFLRELYHYLHMDHGPRKPAADMIWEHDEQHLTAASRFYSEVAERSGVADWSDMQKLFDAAGNDAVSGDNEQLWADCVAAHRGFQLGLEMLLMIPRIGMKSGFSEIAVSDSLEPIFPERFLDEDQIRSLTRALAPPPKASSNEIVTPSGGTFYAREAPHLPILVDEGDHFEAGQPLFIIEVMKMFNKVYAPFAGTVVENLMADAEGRIVHAGQTVFTIVPDEVVIEESDEVVRERQKAVTLGLLT